MSDDYDNHDDRRLILGPIFKYAAIGITVGVVFITGTVTIERNTNRFEQEIAELEEQLAIANAAGGGDNIESETAIVDEAPAAEITADNASTTLQTDADTAAVATETDAFRQNGITIIPAVIQMETPAEHTRSDGHIPEIAESIDSSSITSTPAGTSPTAPAQPPPDEPETFAPESTPADIQQASTADEITGQPDDSNPAQPETDTMNETEANELERTGRLNHREWVDQQRLRHEKWLQEVEERRHQGDIGTRKATQQSLNPAHPRPDEQEKI